MHIHLHLQEHWTVPSLWGHRGVGPGSSQLMCHEGKTKSVRESQRLGLWLGGFGYEPAAPLPQRGGTVRQSSGKNVMMRDVYSRCTVQ